MIRRGGNGVFLECFSELNFGRVRYLSDSISFSSKNKVQDEANGKNNYKLRVPLLKSPGYLGHLSSRVNRRYNEDRYSAYLLELPEDRKLFNFNIFDGHGGDQCSTFLQTHLPSIVESDFLLSQREDDGPRTQLIEAYKNTFGGYWKMWFRNRQNHFKSMTNIDEINLSKIKMHEDLNLRLLMTFLQTDYDYFKRDDNSAGSTCTSAYIDTIYSEEESVGDGPFYFDRGTISKLTVAQVGDTRALIIDRNGEAYPLTEYHHPSSPVESKRLRRYATKFFLTDSFGEERFVTLANTRAFGDVNFKQMGITAEPQVSSIIVGDSTTIASRLTEWERKSYTIGSLGGDELSLVLCSDGVMNSITDQEVADIIMASCRKKPGLATPQSCAEDVVHFVEDVGGDDNATCLVIRLTGWGKWPDIDRTEVLRKERIEDYRPRST